MNKYDETSVYIRLDVSADGRIFGWKNDDCDYFNINQFRDCDICANKELCKEIGKALDKMVTMFNAEIIRGRKHD